MAAAGTQPPAPAPDSHGTCTTFRDFLPNSSVDVFVPTTGSGNGHCTMGVGNQSNGVRKLQLAIDECYPNLRGVLGPVNGIYGTRTRDAVTKVQAIKGVRQDGRYGPETKNAMLWPGFLNETGLAPAGPLI